MLSVKNDCKSHHDRIWTAAEIIVFMAGMPFLGILRMFYHLTFLTPEVCCINAADGGFGRYREWLRAEFRK